MLQKVQFYIANTNDSIFPTINRTTKTITNTRYSSSTSSWNNRYEFSVRGALDSTTTASLLRYLATDSSNVRLFETSTHRFKYQTELLLFNNNCVTKGSLRSLPMPMSAMHAFVCVLVCGHISNRHRICFVRPSSQGARSKQQRKRMRSCVELSVSGSVFVYVCNSSSARIRAFVTTIASA